MAEETEKQTPEEKADVKQESKETADMEKKVEALKTKVNELSKLLDEKKGKTEEQMKENPYPYLMGAFVGGLILGYMMSRKD